MAITRVASVGGSSGNLNVLPLSWPETPAAGDVAIAFHRHRTNLGAISGPPGWTQIGNATTSSDACRVYYLVCTGSESGTIDFTVEGTGSKHEAVVGVYRGVDTSGLSPVHRESSLVGFHPPNVTTTIANCAIITSLSSRDGSVNSFTPPEGYSPLGGANQFGTVGGGASTLGAADNLDPKPAGETRPSPWGGATNNNLVWTVALPPAPVSNDFEESATPLTATGSLSDATGSRGVSEAVSPLSSSSTLEGSASASASSAPHPWTLDAGFSSSGKTDASSESGFSVSSTVSSTGTFRGFSQTQLELTSGMDEASSHARFLSDVSVLSSRVGAGVEGSLGAVSDSGLSVRAETPSPDPRSDTAAAASILEAVSFFTEVEEQLDAVGETDFAVSVELDVSGGLVFDTPATVFSTVVRVDSSGEVRASASSEAFSATSELPLAGTDSDAITSSEDFEVSVTVSAVADAEAVSSATLDTLAGFAAQGSFGSSTQGEDLSVGVVTFGPVEVRRSIDWSIAVTMSTTVTQLPDTSVITPVPDLPINTALPSPQIVTNLPHEIVRTDIDNPRVATHIGDFSTGTEIDDPSTTTSIEDPTLRTEIPDTSIDTTWR